MQDVVIVDSVPASTGRDPQGHEPNLPGIYLNITTDKITPIACAVLLVVTTTGSGYTRPDGVALAPLTTLGL